MNKILSIAGLICFNVVAFSQGSIQLVSDINQNQSGFSSQPGNFCEYNGELFFAARVDSIGTELWKYDGTTVSLVADINEGTSESYPQYFTEYKGKLYFQADHDTLGRELWEYDGTTVSLVADIAAGTNGAWPEYLTVYDDTLYFSASDGLLGTELWRFDGTSVALESDISAGNSSSSPTHLTVHNDTLYFGANDNISGKELWRFNGSTTELAVDIVAGASSSSLADLLVFNDTLYFTASESTTGHELWSYDGTNAINRTDIQAGASSSTVQNLTVNNGTLYFRANDGINGVELWSFDGNTATLEADINTSGNGFPNYLYSHNNILYFTADNGTDGAEFWQFDGTNATMLEDINANFGANPMGYVSYNGNLYFSANDDVVGTEIWMYDGTNTSLAIDVYQGSNGSDLNELIEYNNKIIFSANDGTGLGEELWQFDGTSSTLLADIKTGQDESSDPGEYIVYNNTLYFRAENDTSGRELWKYDGTTTVMVADINPGASGSNPRYFAVYNDTLYFQANDGINGSELWKFDGTSASLVADIKPGSSGGSPENLAVYNGVLYFEGDDDIHGNELMSYDGTSVELVQDIRPGSSDASPEFLTIYNDTLYFKAHGENIGAELWKFDGDTVTLVQDIRPGSSSSTPQHLTVLGDKLIFRAENSTVGTELFQFDGDTVTPIVDLIVGNSGSNPDYLEVYKGNLYFSAKSDISDETKTELYKFDGDTITLVEDYHTFGSASPSHLAVFNKTLYFAADNGLHGKELVSYYVCDTIQTVAIDTVLHESCTGTSDGSIALTITGGETPYTYNWSGPNAYTSTNATATGLTEGTYRVTVSNACISIIDTAVVFVQNTYLSGVTTSGTNVLCNGASTGAIDLEIGAGSTPYTYNWQNDNSFNATTQDLNNLEAGSYTVTVTNACGNVLDTVIITEPVAITGNDTITICEGNSATIGGVVYTGTGDYTAMETAANGCDSVVSVHLIVAPNTLSDSLVVTMTPDNVCSGDTVTLTATGATTYSWNNGITNGQAFVPVASNIYSVTATDNNGCMHTAQTPVVVKSLPSITANATTNSTCTSTSIVLWGEGGISYDWINPVINNGDTIVEDTAGVFIYILEGFAANGCSNTSQVIVNVEEKPQAPAIETAATFTCKDQPFTTKAKATSTAGNVVWFADQELTDQVNVGEELQADYIEVGTFVYYPVTELGGCYSIPTGFAQVLVLDVPSVTSQGDIMAMAGEEVMLEATTENAELIFWSPVEGLSDSTIANPVLTATNSTEFTITVVSEDGCTDSTMVFVEVENEIEIANFFSPNGDGANDTWLIYPTDAIADCTVRVFDGFGRLLFETAGYLNDWDGTFNGDELPDGDYYYHLDCGGRITKGAITLIR